VIPRDDDLARFAADGTPELPPADRDGWVERERRFPHRAAGVFFFGCNVDPTGTKTIDERNPLLGRCFSRHMKDYARLSATPNDFAAFADAVGAMQRSQPNYTAADLAAIPPPVTIVHAEHDEFIERAHADYLARTIPDARFVFLPEVSHFAPLQRPDEFNRVVFDFLRAIETRA